MTRRAEFLAANSGLRAPMPGFVLLVHDRKDGDPTARIGITVTKKIGGAVIRNRMKRRFRALARDLLPSDGVAGADHVLIGRAGGVERDYATLHTELSKALRKLGAKRDAGITGGGGHDRPAKGKSVRQAPAIAPPKASTD